MVFRDILLVLDTYPDPTPPSAMDDAIAIAQALGARISALACAIMLPSTGNILADTLLDMPTILVEEGGKSLANAEAALSRFRRAAEERGIFQESILERFPKSAVAEIFVEYARVRDLTIVPMAEVEGVGRMSAELMIAYAEQIVFGSGRPTIFLRHNQRRRQKSRSRYGHHRLGLQPTGVTRCRGCPANSRDRQASCRRDDDQYQNYGIEGLRRRPR